MWRYGRPRSPDAYSEIEGATAQTALLSRFRRYWRLVPHRARCDEPQRVRVPCNGKKPHSSDRAHLRATVAAAISVLFD